MHFDIDNLLKAKHFLFLFRETFSLELFHSIEVFIQRCLEMMRVDKKQDRVWAKRMHSSVKCYKENIQALFMMEKKLSQIEEEARKTQSQTNDDQVVASIGETGTTAVAETQQPSPHQSDGPRSMENNSQDNDELPDLDNPSFSLLSSTQKTNKTNDQQQQQPATAPQDARSIDERFIDNLRKIKGLKF